MTRRPKPTQIEAVRAAIADAEARTQKRLRNDLAGVYAALEELLSPEDARKLWQSIPPRARRGYRKPNTDVERDTLAILMDLENRQDPIEVKSIAIDGATSNRLIGGMSAMQSAEAIQERFRGGFSTDPEATRRKLDRARGKKKPKG